MKITASQNHTYLFIVILISGAILRFYHIDQPLIDATSWRQASTAMMADNFYRGNWNIFYPEVSWDGPGPSYNGREFQTVTYISALLYVVFGQHDWIGRSLAVIFSLWGIFAFYQLVFRVWNKEYALASAAVLAILPGSIYYDRSFLPDPAMIALVTTSCWFLVAYLQTERWHYLLLASMIGTWGFLTKLPGLMVGIPMLYAIFTIFGLKGLMRPKKLIIIGLSAITILIIVITYYLWARYLSLTYPPYHFAGSGNWLWNNGLHQWWEQKYFLPKLYEFLKDWFWTKPFIILIVIGLFLPPPYGDSTPESEQQLRDKSSKAPWFFHWWIFAFIIYYLIGAQELVDNPSNLIIMNPAAAALAGNALMILVSFTKRIVGSPASMALIAVILLNIGGMGYKDLYWMFYPSAKEDYEMGIALRQITQPSDLVVTIAKTIGDPVSNYYSHRRGWVFPPANTWSTLDWWEGIKDDTEAIQILEELQAKGAEWLGISGEQKQKIWKNNPKLAQYIDKNYKITKGKSEFVIYRMSNYIN